MQLWTSRIYVRADIDVSNDSVKAFGYFNILNIGILLL